MSNQDVSVIGNSLNITFTIPDHPLVEENKQLRSRIKELEYDKMVLNELIVDHKKTIDELREENIKLRARVDELEHVQRTVERENKEQKKEISVLKQKVASMYSKTQYDKLVKVIQDINRCEHLESQGHHKEFYNNRLDRNDVCHFIQPGDIDKLKKYKYVLGRLDEFDANILKYYEKNNPGAITVVKDCFTKLLVENITLTQSDTSDLDFQWSII